MIAPGDSVLLYSDGLVEAHDPAHQMYGFPRLARGDGRRRRRQRAARSCCSTRLRAFTRTPTGSRKRHHARHPAARIRRRRAACAGRSDRCSTQFSVPGEEGNERTRRWIASLRLSPTSASIPLASSASRRRSARRAMNAIEYGSQGRPEVAVEIAVETTPRCRRADHGPGPVRAGPRRRRSA